MSVSVFDATKPATNSAEASAEIRNNFGALQSGMDGNLVADPYLEMWPIDDTHNPAHYTYTSGTGGTIARAGTGLADTGIDASGLGWNGGNQGPIGTNWGAFCAKMVYGSATQVLRQNILGVTGVKSFVGQPFSMGAWVRASVANAARIDLWDGISHNYSSYHNGNGNWQWLTTTMASGISNTATGLMMSLSHEAGTIYANGFVVVMGSVSPLFFIPSPMVRLPIFPGVVAGNLVVGNTQNNYGEDFEHPAIYRATRLHIITAPATQAVIVRPNRGSANGGSSGAIYATNPQIAAAASTGSAGQPDGTYAMRCFGRGDFFYFDITQVGTGTTGANLTLNAEIERYVRPNLPFLSLTEAAG